MESIKASVSFRQMEEETLEEAREWGRQRLEAKLNKLIEEQGAISPPERPGPCPGANAPGKTAKRERSDRR